MCIRRILVTWMVLLIPVCLSLQAQSAFTSGGGDAGGIGGSSSFSVGQLVYSVFSENSGTVIQGVQQPFEISELPGVGIDPGSTIQCRLYPNPVVEELQIQLEEPDEGDIHYELMDLDGQVIRNGMITGPVTRISMSQMGASMYLLKISRSDTDFRTYKLIKK